MIEVVELTASLEQAYAAFLQENERTLLYGTVEFRTFLQQILNATPRYLLAMEDARIVGALPSFIATNTEGRCVLNSLPWYGSHGGCILSPMRDVGARTALLRAYLDLVRAPRVAFASLILPPDESPHLDDYVTLLKPDATDGRIGQITELPLDGPDLETRLDAVLAQKTRNLARKARKQGFTFDVGDDEAGWQFLYDTHLENMAQIGGQAKPWTHFAALRETIPASWRHLTIARLDGEPVAAMLLLRFNRTVEYITPTIRHAFRSLQPLSFLIWHAMLEAVRDGFRWWNWGGTWATQHSLHHFKAGWGAKDHPYHYLIHAAPDAIHALRQNRESVAAAFPYFFVYPYHLLDA
jgi:Acetyltransferase (GNAT) domain